MASIYSVSALNANMIMSASTALSSETINKLKSFGIDPKTVTSEVEAKKLIEQQEHPEEIKETDKASNNESKLEKLYKRLKSLALKLGITVTKNDKINNILDKIHLKIQQFEQDKNNSNINVIKSEYEMIKLEYQNLTTGQSSLLTGMDILSKNNRAVLGI